MGKITLLGQEKENIYIYNYVMERQTETYLHRPSEPYTQQPLHLIHDTWNSSNLHDPISNL